MRVGAHLIQGEGWEQGLAQGKSSRAVANLIQDVHEDFLLRPQGPGSSPHELHLLQTQREQSDGPGATELPGSLLRPRLSLMAPCTPLLSQWFMVKSPSAAFSSRFLLTSQSHRGLHVHPTPPQGRTLPGPASHTLSKSARIPPTWGAHHLSLRVGSIFTF